MEMTFKKGEFIEFQASTTIHLGRLERNINIGDIIEFDGVNLRVGGTETPMPELKAGIKRGWFKFITKEETKEETKVEAPKVEAPKAVQKTKLEVENIYDEESVVGAAITKKENTSAVVSTTDTTPENKFPIVASNEDDDTMTVGSIEDKGGAQINFASSAQDGGVAESQGAQKVNVSIKTAANQKTVLTDASAIDRELSKLEELEPPSFPVIQTEGQAEESDDIFLEENPSDAQVKEAVQILGAVEAGADAVTGAVEVGAKSDTKVVVLASGVEWDMSKHWSKRAKIATDLYGNNTEVLEQIIAVETKGVASSIQDFLSTK